jgi:hypothetical protein
MVDWDFLFSAISAMGFLEEFTAMIKLLFRDATTCVKVNGALS